MKKRSVTNADISGKHYYLCGNNCPGSFSLGIYQSCFSALLLDPAHYLSAEEIMVIIEIPVYLSHSHFQQLTGRQPAQITKINIPQMKMSLECVRLLPSDLNALYNESSLTYWHVNIRERKQPAVIILKDIRNTQQRSS